MRLKCSHADTCLPDYWGGHHLPHVQIPVYPGMKLGEVKRAIKSELAQGAVAGSGDDARLLSADLVRPEEERRADKLTRAAYAAVNRIRLADTRKRRLFTDLDAADCDDDCGDSVYAFFVFVEA